MYNIKKIDIFPKIKHVDHYLKPPDLDDLVFNTTIRFENENVIPVFHTI